MNFEDFMNFKMFISTTFIKIIYVLGVIVITLGSLLLMAGFSLGSAYYGLPFGAGGILVGLAVLIFGNLGWRLLCEAIIVVFSIHERLISIDNKFSLGNKPTPAASPTSVQLPKTQEPPSNFCNNCGTKISLGTKFCANCGTAVLQ